MREPLRVVTAEPETVEELVEALRGLRAERRRLKKDQRVRTISRRRALSVTERSLIHAKTDGRCHICGGTVETRWQADHVLAHSTGGTSRAENYLPAHALCNNYRWDYMPQEFQYILKIGVWARTHIEKRTVLGKALAKAFLLHEGRRRGRRKAGAGRLLRERRP